MANTPHKTWTMSGSKLAILSAFGNLLNSINDCTSKGRRTANGGVNGSLSSTVDGVIGDLCLSIVIVPSGVVLEFTLQQSFTVTPNP
jgi:hypothetical protein